MPQSKLGQTPASGLLGQRLALLLWVLMLALVARITILVRQREGASFVQVDSYATFEICIVGLTLLAIFIGNPRVRIWLHPSVSVFWLLGLYGVGALSAIWSPLPAYSAFRATEQIALLLALLSALQLSSNALQDERRIFIAFLICLILSWATVVKFYGFSISLAAWHTNSYSACAAMILCYCAGELMSGRRILRSRLWIFGGLALFGVVIGTSAASNIAVLCGLAAAAASSRSWKALVFCLFLVCAGAAVSLAGVDLTQVALGGKSAEAVRTLTGRTTLWEDYIPRFFNHTFLGEGYAVSARISELYTTNTHSSVFSVLLGTGLLGAIIYVCWVVMMFNEGRKAIMAHRPFAIGSLAGLVAGIVNSLSSAYMGESYGVATLTFNSLIALHAMYVVRSTRAAQAPRFAFSRCKAVPA